MDASRLCHPNDFANLSEDQQKEVFELAKQCANYKEETNTYMGYFYHPDEGYKLLKEPTQYTIGSIYRPILIEELPSGWDFYIPYLHKEFPKGEKMTFHNKSMNIKNYKILYTWCHHGCTSCHASKSNIHWEEGDKRIEYVCSNCRDETPFVRHISSFD